jgi:hypothetical protein
MDIQRTYQQEYNSLTQEEREDVVRKFKENIDTSKRIARPSPRGRIQDFANTVRNIILLVCG